MDDMDKALERVDSAEEAGVFTPVWANTVRAIIYENASLRQMATYYAQKAIAAEAGQDVTTQADSIIHTTARWIVADGAYVNGEYGKTLSLAKELLAFTGDGTTPKDIEMKCRALELMAGCESELGHVDKAERLYLQSIDILMESTQHTSRSGNVYTLVYTLLSLNDLYLEKNMPERALPLLAKMDTATNRLIHCYGKDSRLVQEYRNNVTISKAMVYAANGHYPQAEALFREHQQSQGLDPTDKTAEGFYLTMMGHYDEAVRMFDEADSMMRSNGTPIIVK